ncbi:MAG: NADH-quinone oxidoreductase subunit N [Bacteroidaceae bacterium]|jgi:NADH-quinone oxidoreductase subunit N
MDYSQFLNMKEELSLMVVIAIVLLYDIIAGDKRKKTMTPVVIALMVLHTAFTLIPSASYSIFGGMYTHTPMMSIVKAILNFGVIIVFLQADVWLRREDTKIRAGEFYELILCTLLGMYMMIGAGHFLMFYIGLETASVPMAALVAFDKYRHHSAEAGAKYILTAMFSSALLIFGLSLVYGSCGSLYFDDVTMTIRSGGYMAICALVLFISGMGFKLSLVPFHLWTADVYQGAPTNVTSYLSVISKGAAAFAFMTILIKAFPDMMPQWQTALYILIVLSITIANLFALRQQDLKRFMAFSSISQAGYIMLGVIGGNALGMTSLVYYVLVYVVANLAIFGIINVVEQKSGKKEINEYNGFYQTNPKLTFVMTLALFSLGGIPPFAGFFSKFFIFAAAVEKGYVWLVFIALLNTVISLYYYLLIVKAMFIQPNDSPIATFKSDAYSRVSLVICLVGIVGFGLISAIYDCIHAYSYGL